MRNKLLFVLIVGILIVVISSIPPAGAFVLSLFVAPRLYIVIGVCVLIVLYKILIELRNRNERDDDE